MLRSRRRDSGSGVSSVLFLGGWLAACALPVCAGQIKVTDTGYVPHRGRKGAPAAIWRTVTMDTGKTRYKLYLNGRSIGMPGPSRANFYTARFFSVSVGKERYFTGKAVPRDEFREVVQTRLIEDEEWAELIATQEGENARIEVGLKATAGEEHLDMTVKVTRKEKMLSWGIRFLAYPSDYTRKAGHKVVTFSSGRTAEFKYGEGLQVDAKIHAGESWVYMCDATRDIDVRGGGGGCAVRWRPDEVRGGRVKMGSYAIQPILGVKPNVTTARFRLWDLGGKSNAAGLALMKGLSEAGGAE